MTSNYSNLQAMAIYKRSSTLIANKFLIPAYRYYAQMTSLDVSFQWIAKSIFPVTSIVRTSIFFRFANYLGHTVFGCQMIGVPVIFEKFFFAVCLRTFIGLQRSHNVNVKYFFIITQIWITFFPSCFVRIWASSLSWIVNHLGHFEQWSFNFSSFLEGPVFLLCTFAVWLLNNLFVSKTLLHPSTVHANVVFCRDCSRSSFLCLVICDPKELFKSNRFPQ